MKKKVNGKEFIAKNRIVIGVVMLFCAAVLGIFILPRAITKTTSYEVLIVNCDVAPGTSLTADMINVAKTTDSNLAATAYSSTDNVVGLVTNTTIYSGQYLLKSSINGGMQGTATPSQEPTSPDVVPSGKQLIAVPVPSLSASVSYSLKSGDVVRFYSMYLKGDLQGQAYTPEELQYVEVYEVYDGSGIACSVSGAAPSSITLIVTQKQAERVVELVNNAKTYFSLMSSGDAARAKAFLEYQTQVLDNLLAAQESLERAEQENSQNDQIVVPTEGQETEPNTTATEPTP